jgi:hypothetical protein
MPVGNIPLLSAYYFGVLAFRSIAFYSRQILSILFLPSFEQDYSFYYLILG